METMDYWIKEAKKECNGRHRDNLALSLNLLFIAVVLLYPMKKATECNGSHRDNWRTARFRGGSHKG